MAFGVVDPNTMYGPPVPGFSDKYINLTKYFRTALISCINFYFMAYFSN